MSLVGADVVHGQNVWMVERACGDRFLGKTALTLGIDALRHRAGP